MSPLTVEAMQEILGQPEKKPLSQVERIFYLIACATHFTLPSKRGWTEKRVRKEIKKRGLDKLDHKGKIADLAVICATAPEHELADILAKEYVAMSLVLNRQQSPEDFFQWALDRHVVLMHPFSLGVTLKNAQDFIANLTAPKVNVSTLVH